MVDINGFPSDRVGVAALVVGFVVAVAAQLVRRRRSPAATDDTSEPVARRPVEPPPLDRSTPQLPAHVAWDTEAWIAAAIRSLGARPIWNGERVAQPLLARLTDSSLEMELSDADAMAAPLPWLDVAAGRRWRLPRSTPIGRLPLADVERPMPAIVAVGPGLLVNLEGVGILTIDGAIEHAMGLVRSMVEQLRRAGPHGLADVRSTFAITGIGATGLVGRSSPADLMAELPSRFDEIERALLARSACSAYSHRIAGAEPMTPIVVITDPVGARDMPIVVEAAAHRRLPVAVVVVGGCAETGEASITLDTWESAVLEPWGIRFRPQRRAASAGRRLAELLDGASRAHRVARRPRRHAAVPAQHAHPQGKTRTRGRQLAVAIGPEPPDWPIAPERRRRSPAPSEPDPELDFEGRRPAPPDATPPAAGLPAESPAIELLPVDPQPTESPPPDGRTAARPAPDEPAPEIRVLGPVELVGLDIDLTSQQLALVTYLACHPSASRDDIVDALWDGQVISKSRFPNLLAETRARIGREHLPEASEGRYRIDGIGTDLARLERAVAQTSDGDVEGDARPLLRSALQLVRGVPFTPPSLRFWAWAANRGHIAARVESTIADIAARLAREEQADGAYDGARWACEQGLLASPADETLVTILTEVYLALGKPALAMRLVESWEEEIARLDCGEPSAEPRRRLRGGRRPD